MVGGGEQHSDSSTNQSWPTISQGERTLYEILFYSQGPVDGYILGEGVRELLLKSGLSLTVLSQIWNLADVTNDNVLNVHEFSLVMHLIRGRMAGLVVPQTLPRCLTPPKVQPQAPPPMSQQEKDAYLRVFQALDVKRTGFIDGTVAMALLKSSGLSHDVITSVWDVADFGRDGRLNPDELAIAGHLVRHVKAGNSLDGPVDIFKYAPQHISPISLLARKRRVAEYQEHKQRLMSLKETRKQQATREARRLELVKNKIKCLEELVTLLRKLDKSDGPEGAQIEQTLRQDKDEVKKQEEIVFRLKKEHEKVRQETVKIILGEHVFNEDIRLIKVDTDELNKRLLTSHSHATKDADPFHQLYEQRKEKRQGSTIKDLDKIDIYIPFEFSPFDLEVTPHTLPSGARILQESENKGGGSLDSDVLSVINDVKGFGDQFMQDWGGSTAPSLTSAATTVIVSSSTSLLAPVSSMATASTAPSPVLSSSERKEFEDDEIFMEGEENHYPWPLLDGSNNDSLLGLTGDQVVSLKAKLNDLRTELKQLNTDHRKLIFRNPEDYLARQKAKEAEELNERGRISRRSAAERLRNHTSTSSSRTARDESGSGSGVRYRVTSDRSSPSSETSQAVRDYRLKRRSLNLDSASTSSSPESSRRTNLTQDTGGNRRIVSSLGSASVSDEASLSRQSSLSSTDRPGTSPSGSVSQLQTSSQIKDIVEETSSASQLSSINETETRKSPRTAPATTAITTSTSSPYGDSSVLKLRSNRRKDELSLALGATALGRQITVEPVAPPVSSTTTATANKSILGSLLEPKSNSDTSVNNSIVVTNEVKRELLTDRIPKDISREELVNGEWKKLEPKNQNPSIKTTTAAKTSSKKSRAPQPPTSPIHSENTRKSEETKLINSPTEVITIIPHVIPNNNLENNCVSQTKAEEPDLPRRPPRLKKTSSSENRNSGSFTSTSSISSSFTDSIDKDALKCGNEKDKVLSPEPTQEIMSSARVSNSNTQQALPHSPRAPASTKKRPAPSPFPVQNASSPTKDPPLFSSTSTQLKSQTASNDVKLSSRDNDKTRLVHVDIISKDDTKDAVTDIIRSKNTLIIEREDNDSSPTPPPLPASPPPLPSSFPPFMQEDLSIEEEVVTVEYTSPVNICPVSSSPSSLSVSSKPSTSTSAPTFSPNTPKGYRSDFDDVDSSPSRHFNVSSPGLNLHHGVNGNTGTDDTDSSSADDSDLTDSDGEDQKGKYEIFSPGDSGILTSSIATTPDESDGNIELVNYTPYNNNDIITNNNYLTTNFNFVNRNNVAAEPPPPPPPPPTVATTPLDPSTNQTDGISTTANATSSSISATTTIQGDETSLENAILPSIADRIANSPFEKPSPVQSPKQSRPVVEEEVLVASKKQPPQMAPPPSSDIQTISTGKKIIGKTSDNLVTGEKGQVVLEEDESSFRSSLPKWSSKQDDNVMTPRSQDIMSKARHFADMVQPKQVIVLKSASGGTSKNGDGSVLPETSLEDVTKQRQDIISQATTRRKLEVGFGTLQHQDNQSQQHQQQQQKQKQKQRQEPVERPKAPIVNLENAQGDEDGEY